MALALIAAGWLASRPALGFAQSNADRFAVVVSQADSAWELRRYSAARSSYALALAIDSTRAPRALFRLALLESWDRRFPQAMSLFRRYLAIEPRDEEGRIALARTHAWNGDTDRAVALFDSALTGNPEIRDAAVGGALALAWAKRYERAEDRYRRWLANHPDDADAWIGLGQTLRWAGRPERAKQAYERALAVEPDNRSAARHLHSIRAELGWVATPTAVASWDSDRNRSVLVRGGLGLVLFPGSRLTVTGSYRSAELGQLTGWSEGATAALRIPAGRSVAFTGEAGAFRTRGEQGTVVRERTEPVGGLAVSLRPGDRISLGAHLRRDVFDETAALLAAAVTVSTVGGEGELGLGSRFALGAGGEIAEFRGGSGPNRRRAGFAAIRWRASSQVIGSLVGRAFGYDVLARDGYFAPSGFRLTEAGLRWAPGGEEGWAAWVDLGVGIQRVAFAGPADSRGTQRIGVGVVHRFSPGSEVGVEYGFSNVAAAAAALTTTRALYRSHVAALRLRLVW